MLGQGLRGARRSMTQSSFQERLKRLEANAGKKVQMAPMVEDPVQAPARKRPSFLLRFLVIFPCLIAGTAGAFLVKLALDPDMTPEAAHYATAMGLAGGFILLMLGLVAASLLTRFRRPLLTLSALVTAGTYGAMTALLNMAVA